MKATVPGRAIAPASVAFSPVYGLMTPRQFGPMRRIVPPLPQHVALERRSRFAHFPETGGDDHGALHAGAGAFADNVRHGGGRSRHQREIDFLRDIGDAGIGFDAEHARALGVHGEHGAAEGATGEIRDQRTANAARRLRRSDDGHIAWLEENVEREPGFRLHTSKVSSKRGRRRQRLSDGGAAISDHAA